MNMPLNERLCPFYPHFFLLTYRCGPYTCYSHVFLSLPRPIHRQPLREDAHGNLTHCIRSLPPEETRIDRRTNNNDTSFPTISLEMRERCLDCSVESLGVDLLHKKVALHRCILYRCPPYCTRIIDDYIEMTINLAIVNRRKYAREIL
jgi:hypothetical protein